MKHIATVILTISLLLLPAALAPAALAQAGQERLAYVSLDEAVALAFEHSLKLEQSRLSLQEAELGLKQARANNLVQPSPTALIQAERQVDIAARQLLLDQFDLKLEVEEAYYSVLRAQNLIAVLEEALRVSRRQLEIAEERFARGTGTQAELLGAASQVAQNEANLAQAQGGYEIALLNFRRVLGVDFAEPIAPLASEFAFEPYEVSLQDDIAFALERRIEILQALLGVEAAQKQVELYENDYTPELALELAKVALAKAHNGLEQLRRGIQLEIRQAHLSLQDAARRIPALAKSVAEAEENLRVAQSMYEVDMAPFVQVMGAQVALANARTEYVHAIYDYNLARARYERAVARPLEGGDAR